MVFYFSLPYQVTQVNYTLYLSSTSPTPIAYTLTLSFGTLPSFADKECYTGWNVALQGPKFSYYGSFKLDFIFGYAPALGMKQTQSSFTINECNTGSFYNTQYPQIQDLYPYTGKFLFCVSLPATGTPAKIAYASDVFTNQTIAPGKSMYYAITYTYRSYTQSIITVKVTETGQVQNKLTVWGEPGQCATTPPQS